MLGLDFGTYSIKAVHARQAGNGYEVARWAEVSTPEGAITEGQVNPGPELAAARRDLLQKLGPGPRETAVAIPAQLALVRRIAMPKLPARRLRALIEGQGHQFIPFFRDGATFDFVVVNPNLSEKEQELLLVAVPTSPVDKLRAALRAAGLRLAAVDVDMLALYRAALAAGTLTPGAPAALLDAGHRRARLGLFADGYPNMVRTLDVLPLLPGEAEPPPDVRYLAPEEFAVEVRRTMEILLGQARTGAVPGLLRPLVGTGHGGPAGGGTAQRLGLPQRGRTAGGGSGRRGRAPGLALAFGLSLCTAVKPHRLALLPRPPLDAQRQRRIAAAFLAASVVGSGAYGWFWYQKDLQMQADTVRLTQAIATHNAYLAREKDIAAQEALRKGFDPLLAAYNISEPWSVLYPHLRSLLPPGPHPPDGERERPEPGHHRPGYFRRRSGRICPAAAYLSACEPARPGYVRAVAGRNFCGDRHTEAPRGREQVDAGQGTPEYDPRNHWLAAPRHGWVLGIPAAGGAKAG